MASDRFDVRIKVGAGLQVDLKNLHTGFCGGPYSIKRCGIGTRSGNRPSMRDQSQLKDNDQEPSI